MASTSSLIAGAAITEETASWLGSWADALITISHPIPKLRKIIEAFRISGGEGKPLILKLQLSYDKTEAEALKGAFSEWKTNIFQSKLISELRSPQQFQAAADFMDEKVMYEHVRVSANFRDHIQWIKEYISLGFDEIILHNVNTNQQRFIDDFGSKVLPELQ